MLSSRHPRPFSMTILEMLCQFLYLTNKGLSSQEVVMQQLNYGTTEIRNNVLVPIMGMNQILIQLRTSLIMVMFLRLVLMTVRVAYLASNLVVKSINIPMIRFYVG